MARKRGTKAKPGVEVFNSVATNGGKGGPGVKIIGGKGSKGGKREPHRGREPSSHHTRRSAG